MVLGTLVLLIYFAVLVLNEFREEQLALLRYAPVPGRGAPQILDRLIL